MQKSVLIQPRTVLSKFPKNSQQLEKKSKHFKTNIEVTGPDGAYVQGAPRKEPYYGGGDDGEEDYY